MPSDDYFYGAFISYAREDRELAEALQQKLEAFAKPSNVARGIRVFRDVTSLPAGGALSNRLRNALGASEFLILIASPDSAKAEWVRKEVEAFLETHPSDHVILVLSRGRLVWDAAAKSYGDDSESAFPPLRIFDDEPLYLNLTAWHGTSGGRESNAVLEDSVASLAATITGRPKDELTGAHLREYDQERRRLRFNLAFRGAIVAGVVAFVANAILSVVLGSPGLALVIAFALAGATTAVSLRMGWRGTAGVGVAFCIAGAAAVITGIHPYVRESVAGGAVILCLPPILFVLAGITAGFISRGVDTESIASSFGITGLLLSAATLLVPNGKPFAFDLPVLTPPWTRDRLLFALEILAKEFGPGDEPYAYTSLMLGCALSLGMLLGLHRGSYERAGRTPGLWDRFYTPRSRTIAKISAAAFLFVFIAGTTYEMSAAHQKSSIAAELSPSVFREIGGNLDDLDGDPGSDYRNVFRAALTARAALRQTGLTAEASALTQLLDEWQGTYTQELGGSPGNFENLSVVARTLAELGNEEELKNLIADAEGRAREHPVAWIGVVRTALALNVSAEHKNQILDALWVARQTMQTSTDVGNVAVLMHAAGRVDQANRALDDALAIVADYYRTNRAGGSHPIWFDDGVARLIWVMGRWGTLPDWRIDLDTSEVAIAMARDARWDDALELVRSDRSSGYEPAVRQIARIAAEAGDPATAFRAIESLQEEDDVAAGLPAWAFVENVENVLAPSRESAEMHQRLNTIRAAAERKAEEEEACDWCSTSELTRLTFVLLRTGTGIDELPWIDQIAKQLEQAGTVEAGDLLLELSKRRRAIGDLEGAMRDLRGAWTCYHRAEGRVDPQCEGLSRVATELLDTGRLIAARAVAAECLPWRFHDENAGRLNVLAEALKAWSH